MFRTICGRRTASWVLAFAGAVIVCPSIAAATMISVTGTYTGTINGEPFAASIAPGDGSLDTTGLTPATTHINFTAIPNPSFTPIAFANSQLTIYCPIGGRPIGAGVQNLFDLTGGNYTAERTFTWPDYPGSSIAATGSVSTTGTDLSFLIDMTGTYNGPTDITGISDYVVHWTQGPPGELRETASATLSRSGGAPFSVEYVTTFFGLSGSLNMDQIGYYDPRRFDYVATGDTTGVYDVELAIVFIPEPATLIFLGSGAVILLCGRRRATR
ncbi:MAG: hypothetical protein H6819_10100 [Phycisphaerales bacterium]|nr:hypothetical protein [Phycisphaerales bacterium]MCB9858001.1 hypothetical protein [Phycisphaerales bacterium]